MADEIFKILNSRLIYFENNCSAIQKERLLNAYYENCSVNLSVVIFTAFQDVNKKYRLNMTATQIEARIKGTREQFLKDAVKLIQGASRRVDPYKALVEIIRKPV